MGLNSIPEELPPFIEGKLAAGLSLDELEARRSGG
jgi:hypothetical protein